MTARTPIERAAEAVYKLYDQVYTLTATDIPRAAFESIDWEGLARVLREHEWGTGVVGDRCKCGADTDGDHAAHRATAIRAWLLSEGGA